MASQAAEAVSGAVVGPEVEISGASFDSRMLVPGELFVPIVAERNGHDFIQSALDSGCAAYLTSESVLGGTAIQVSDTAQALMKLAAWARTRLDIPVVGVTGSVGKTSTKDLISAALSATRPTTANVRSFNNEQGLPVTILGAPDDTGALVVEMGMRGFGEIQRLCEVATPTIGVVTAVASSHTERVGSIDGVVRAKRELVEAVPASGVVVLNADDARVAAMSSHTSARVVTYGVSGDVRIHSIELDELARPSFEVDSPWGGGQVQLSVSGVHMASNAAAAIAVAGVVEERIDEALVALESATISEMRMQVTVARSGAIVVNDAYNANPMSMKAALASVADMAATRRIAVLGEMAELDDPISAHEQVMDAAVELGIDVVAVGTDLYGVRPLADPLSAMSDLGPGDVVLVKASRVAALDRVADSLISM
jgi:UDP-N-acetylmuramoyl-tripeptide--D-alanyl-D-alanine ligase